MVINEWVVINGTIKQGSRTEVASALAAPSAEDMYSALLCNYPKFFKMDKLCKWAWVAAEYLFGGKDEVYMGLNKHRVAVCLTTGHGCIDVDKRYLDGIKIASPGLFVYTLPNIMLGELCIRHGFKGEQQCLVSEKFDAEELCFTVKGLLDRGMDGCLCGWVDVYGDVYDVCLFWVTKKGSGYSFTAGNMQELYNNGVK